MSRSPTPSMQEQFLHVPIEWAFEAFTNPQHLAGWLCDGALVLPQRGGTYELRFGVGDDEVSVIGQVQRWEPPAGLELTWPGGESLELDLAPGLGGTDTRLKVSPGTGDATVGPGGRRINEIWDGALDALARYFGSLQR